MSETNPYQELLEQLQACESQEERDWLSLCFSIAQLPKELQAAVRAAAVPRFFDRAFLNALLDRPLDEAQFAQLFEQSYIEPYPGEERFNVHERSRRLLQERLWQEDETLYRKISRRAFAYCQEQDQDDTTWRIETIYHQLIAEPDEGADTLDSTFSEWMNSFSYEKVESLLLGVREHQGLKRLLEKISYYFLLYQAWLDRLYSRNRQAKDVLEQIPWVIVKDDEPYLAANGLQVLGDVHLNLSELSEARKCYKEGILIYRELGSRLGEANCLQSLGDVHLRLSELPSARKRYEECLPIYREIGSRLGEANCLRSLGEVCMRLSELPEAEKHFADALQQYQDISEPVGEADSLRMFGKLAMQNGEFSVAQQYIEQASALFERIQRWEGVAECLEGFAELHQAQGQLQQAEEYWQKAADKYREFSMPLRAEQCLEQVRQLKEQGEEMTKQKNKNN